MPAHYLTFTAFAEELSTLTEDGGGIGGSERRHGFGARYLGDARIAELVPSFSGSTIFSTIGSVPSNCQQTAAVCQVVPVAVGGVALSAGAGCRGSC